MRVLITGSQGQVGQELVRLAPPETLAIALGSTELDISCSKAVQQAMQRYQPDLIINAAAYTAVDKAESDSLKACAVNHGGSLNLAQAAAQAGIPLLHISTDYVFDGLSSRPYLESDPCLPQGVYGSSKLAGEQAIIANCPRHLILRTSWVFGARGSNFVKTMLRLAQTRTELSVVADQQGCPTSARSIAQTLWSLAIACRNNPEQPWGIYHYSGTPTCSWYDFAQEIFHQARHLGLLQQTPQLHAITTADYPTAAKRPAYSVLDNSAIGNAFAIRPKDWRDELQNVLQELAQAAND